MSYTGYAQWTTGKTLYAKPLPLVTGASWDSDEIAAAENGSTGSYSFASLDENTSYIVFIQAGASPASSDEAIADFKSKSDIASAARDSILDRVLDGNHDVSGSVGEKLQESGTVVLPTGVTVPSRKGGSTVVLYLDETITESLTVTDANGDALDLSGKTLAVEVEDLDGNDVATVSNASITISGAGNNVASFAWPSAVTQYARVLKYALRDASAPRTFYAGASIEVRSTPETD